MKFHRVFAAGFASLLTAYTSYVLLDTFLIPRTYQKDATAVNYSLFTEEAQSSRTANQTQSDASRADSTKTTAAAEAFSSGSGHTIQSDEASYADENVTIRLQTVQAFDSSVYIADIQLSSVAYLKTAFANDSYGRNIKAKTSEIAAAHNALLAINGDFYGTQERGIVIRNGVLYRDTPGKNDVLCIYADGTIEVQTPDAMTGAEMLDAGVWQAFSFGPGLLENGEIVIDERDEVGRAMASNPRTAVGMITPLHYVFVVSDGRTSASAGLSLYELAEVMQQYGVQTAYNLDGGGSSTMVFQGNVVNLPTTNGGRISERSVSDIVYIG